MKTLALTLLFGLIHLNLFSISISPQYASLTANGPALPISVCTNNDYELQHSPNILLSDNSSVTYPASFSFEDTKAWVAVRDKVNGTLDTCHISIVPWVANTSELNVINQINERHAILGKADESLMVIHNNKLYEAEDDLNDLKFLSNFNLKPADFYWAYLRTPAGSFIRMEKDIYFSEDERNWSLDYTTEGRGIRNSFCYVLDSIANTTHVFTHDYSTTGLDTFPHSIYRKSISPLETTTWEKVFTLYGKDEWALNKSLFPACRHIHTIVNDPYTGHLWMGTGDANQHSHIFYSDDYGLSWKHIGMGSQQWRILSLWFTEKFIYWSMDTAAPPQKIFRISRDIFNQFGHWPDMTPLLCEGTLKNNDRYMIATISEDNYYYRNGYRVGDIVWGTTSVELDKDNQFYALDDPAYDYREVVAELPNNALWAYTIAHDQKGDQVALISANCEGQLIDDRPRVFGVKELVDGTADVQELLSSNLARTVYAQFYPFEQDHEGNMYFLPINMYEYPANAIIQTRLTWNDNSNYNPGVLSVSQTNNKVVLRLNLTGCEADSIVWQQALNKKFNWFNYSSGNESTTELQMTIQNEDPEYFRAMTYKEGHPPTASNYVSVCKNTIYTDIKNNHIRSGQISHKVVFKLLTLQSHRKCSDDLNISIFDMSGRLVYQKIGKFDHNSSLKIDLSNLANGIYILKVLGDKQECLSDKIIIM